MKPTALHVLALAPYPSSAPSTGFRIAQFVPALEERGVHVDFRPFLSEAEYRAARGEGGLTVRAGTVVRAFARLTRTIRDAERFDVVWVQRGMAPLLDRWFLSRLRRRGTPLVYDFDDAVHLPQAGGRRWAELLRDPRNTTTAFCRQAAVVLAGNAFLAAFAREAVGPLDAAKVRILPTVVDTERYRPAGERADGPVVVGWVGSDSTVPFIEGIGGALRRVAQRHGCPIRVVATSRRPRIEGVEVEFIPWTPEADLRVFRSLDIGLYPVDDSAWSRGKCGLKALLYLACGVPCVASPVGVLNEIVRDGETGFLAATEDEWVRGVERLLSDPRARAIMGARGRKFVVAAYSVTSAAPTLAEVFHEAARTRATLPRKSR